MNNHTAEKFVDFADSRGGLSMLGAWAFLEPSFWFVAPDLFLWLMCLYSPKKYVKFAWITLVSALGGASFYFLLNLFLFDKLTPVLMATPFVSEGMLAQIEDILAKYGLAGLLFQAFSFMSVKIWVHVAVEKGLPFLAFITLTGVSRALRFFVFAWIFSRIGARFETLLRRYFIPFAILFALGFIAILLIMETTFVLK